MARLHKLCVGEDNILIYYDDGRARLWDLKTREHWRTMNSEKADEMVKAGGWQTWYAFPHHFTSLRIPHSLSSGTQTTV